MLSTAVCLQLIIIAQVVATDQATRPCLPLSKLATSHHIIHAVLLCKSVRAVSISSISMVSTMLLEAYTVK